MGVGAAGVRHAQGAVKALGDLGGQGDGERVEGAAAHVHLLAGELGAGDVDREGVGELHAELEAALVAEGAQALDHGNGVGPLKVLDEVVVVEGDVVVAQAVEGGAGELVAEERGVALDVGVEPLLADEVGGDLLDLGGWAAVEGGLGDGGGDMGRDGVDEGLVHHLEQVEVVAGPRDGLLEDLGVGGVLHALDVGVDLRGGDALVVVAHAHVEDEAVGVAEAELAGDELAGHPGLDVLGEGLGHGELGGPLAVVGLVGREDAGLGDAGGELGSVHLLHGLELEEPGTAHIAGHEVLGELGVGAGGHAEGGLDALVEDGEGALGVAAHDALLAEDGALGAVLVEDPGHEVVEADGAHDVAHGCPICRGRGFRPLPLG